MRLVLCLAALSLALPLLDAAPASAATCTAPTISGVEQDGETLTGSGGGCTGLLPVVNYEWFSCTNANGTGCISRSAATASPQPYNIVSADVGSYIMLRITGTDILGTDTKFDITGQIAATPPVNNVAPTIPTSARKAGESLTVSSNGTWSGTPTITYGYQWLRCNASGQACSAIAGATSATYGLVAADVGSRLRVRVIGTNAGGSTPADSNPSAVVDPDPPVNTSDPTISGTPRDGELLTGDDGEWDGPGKPYTFARSWQRCSTAEPGSCVDIPGAGGLTYQLTSQDVGSRVRLLVAAFGAYGFATEASEMSGVVEAVPPVNSTPPEVLGTTRRGEELSASPGFWTGSSPITFGYSWQRCATADPASCVDIPFAGAQDYTLTANDVGMRMRVRVLADNPAPGSPEPASSALTDVVLDREGTAGPSLLSPFPRIAIGGKLTRRGARLTLLRIRGEAGARVTVRCRGRGCPFRRARFAMRRRTLRIKRLERRLRAGVVIEIFVAKPGKIGKYTRFRIRRGRAPQRRDACLQPGSSRPSTCPR